MSSSTLYRLCGLALLIALPIQIAGWLLHPAGESLRDLLNPLQTPAHVIMVISFLFVLLGLPGLYARQAHRAGVLGLIGLVLTMIMTAYHIYLLLYEAFPAPILARIPTTQPLIVTGGVLARHPDPRQSAAHPGVAAVRHCDGAGGRAATLVGLVAARQRPHDDPGSRANTFPIGSG